MKIALLDVQTRDTAINKTMAGGYGTSSKFYEGNNILIKLLMSIKRKNVKIPLIELAYLSKIFKQKNHETSVMYGNNLPDADIYIIYGSLVEFNAEIQMAVKIREAKPKAKIGFIGLFPTVNPDIFKNYSDFIVIGEPYSFFLSCNDGYVLLDGIISSHCIDNLDILPFPDWSSFPMKEFVHYPFFGKRPVYPILTSNGCAFSCKYYCAYPIMTDGKVHFRSIENVIEEFKYLARDYSAEAVLFRDANFGINKEHAFKLCEAILKNNIKLRWACESHPSCLNKDLIDLMYRSGNRAITLGIETRNADVIKRSKRKDTDETHLRDVLHYCECKGIKIMAHYILGSIADTRQTILNTIDYAASLNTSFAQFNISTPYPGTEYYHLLENRLTTNDWTRYDTFTLVFNHPNISFDEMENLKKIAYIRYYYRPKWIIGKLLRSKLHDLFDRR